MNHTPTPLQANAGKDRYGSFIIVADNYRSAMPDALTAVEVAFRINAHDELVAALRDLLDSNDSHTREQARAALAKVQS